MYREATKEDYEVIQTIKLLLIERPADSIKELIARVQKVGYPKIKYIEHYLRLTRMDPVAYGGCVCKIKPGSNKRGEPRLFWMTIDDEGYLLMDTNRAARFSYDDGEVASSADMVTMAISRRNQLECALANTKNPARRKLHERHKRIMNFIADEFKAMEDDLRELREKDIA